MTWLDIESYMMVYGGWQAIKFYYSTVQTPPPPLPISPCLSYVPPS